MAQLRLALAQLDPTVGDLDGNAALVRRWAARASAAGAHLAAFPETVLTGYPVEDLALRASFVDASLATLHRLAADLAAEGLGELPVVVGYIDRVTQDGNSSAAPVAGVPKGEPQNCAALLHRGAGGHPVRQAPPAQLRRLRRVPDLRARPRPGGGPGPRRRRGHRHLRGPLAARRPGRADPAGRGRAAAGDQRLALRAQQGRRPAGPGAAPQRRGRLPAGLREHGRRPGRPGLRRRLDRGRPGRAGAGPGPAVRRDPARGRPGAAGRPRARGAAGGAPGSAG